MPYLQLAPWLLGTRFTFVRQPLAQLSLAFQGSKDCNPRSATPSDVRGKQGIIISHADHGDTALWLFFSGMDRSVQSRHLAGYELVRHGASPITLPAPGTYLRAGDSVVKVPAVLLHKVKIVEDALHYFLISLR